MIRYRADNLPARGVGAFAPIPAISPNASSWGLVDTHGFPGNLPIDCPDPDESLPSLTAQPHGVNTARPSDVTPDYILPVIYFTRIFRAFGPGGTTIGLGMTARRFNEMPVPAGDWTRIPITSGTYQPAKIGGRIAMNWPRAFQRFTRRPQT